MVTLAVSKTRHFDSPQQAAYLNLWRTYDQLKEVEDGLFSKYDLSAQQYNALRLLRSAHPGTMPTLALGGLLISRAPDMTRLLDKLERRQLVHRERRDENRRVVEVGITQAGLDLLEELAEPVLEVHRQQLGHLDAEELELLTRLLEKARGEGPGDRG
ncbi:MarR family winged helix-turn-helix transcriptional regulator [Planctomicrobium piriforme]|uniref:DNA-binding transcriptional regulator, MarR family n=1 Tax=Planctomicrobium piriforme TaxID=1576369 RepID=A0A1I3LN18_9PLAN|nr:MarR family transcriptional regulator [Planctomicrobium piriforme]SFI85885.1 DNA-binding transcriptional regulator, MarR family [Planctomicrobium piriforme]